MYEDQYGEFIYRYWGLIRAIDEDIAVFGHLCA